MLRHGGRPKKILRGFEASKLNLFWTPCTICEKFLVNRNGVRGRERLPEEKPNCSHCVKLTHEDAISDERVIKALVFYRLGIPETDDIIREDSWTYSAVRIIQRHVEDKEMRKVKGEMERARRTRL
jgi:hypothetical protein